MRELAVVGEAADREVDVDPFGRLGRVRDLLLDEGLDEGDDVADVIRHARLDVGGQDADGAHLLLDQAGHARREGERLFTGGLRGRQDLVVHVGEVPDIVDVEASRAKVPNENVEREVGARVPRVGPRVRRRAADVDADLARNAGLEGL